MKVIELSRGRVAVVDDEDFDELAQYRWSCTKEGYAARTQWIKGKNKSRRVYMHRQLMGHPVGLQIDHVNMDPLDNRRCNLRLATMSENRMNEPKKKSNTSGFKGVSRNRKRWKAEIQYRGERYRLGTFDTPEEAAMAYNAAAPKIHGEFARLNQFN